MAYDSDERIAVVVGPTSVGVTLTLGEVRVSVQAPLPPGATNPNPDHGRAAALRAARRALEVALEELAAAVP